MWMSLSSSLAQSGSMSRCRRRQLALPLAVLIFMLNRQCLCSAGWATGTAAAPAPVPAVVGAHTLASAAALASEMPRVATPPPVSSSEATLLTGGAHYLPLTAATAAAAAAAANAASDGVAAADQVARNGHDEAQVMAPSAAALTAAETGVPNAPPQEMNDIDAGMEGSNDGDGYADVDGGNGGGSGGGSAAHLRKNRYKIVSLETNCTRDLFEVQLQLNREFHGLLYAKDFPLECRARGTARSSVVLRLPTSGCGVRVEPHANGGYMELSVRVMLQMEQKLRQSSDILRTVRCKLPLNAMGMTVEPSNGADDDADGGADAQADGSTQSYRNGRMRSFADDSANNTITTMQHEEPTATEHTSAQQRQQQQVTATTSNSTTSSSTSPSSPSSPSSSTSSTSTPRVRIWLELGDRDGSGAVEVGQATTLTVRAIVPGTMGVRVVDCAALDGLGESTQQLLDERGCPIDEQVMPALHTRFKPAEEGWSKHNDDDLIEKIFTATFPAFKFPDRERLHVSCGVQLCKANCPNVNCRMPDSLGLSGDAHLARIEVFNSLAVTAPQIEVDRLRYDRHYNMSVEEYPPNIRPLPTEGTLCLSISKLAISFCVLGVIFLVAVIVALCSLIRSRRRAAAHSGCSLRTNGNRLHRAEVCTSMFSSSSESAQSARFGSKLFIPYYPNTMPYGRVY